METGKSPGGGSGGYSGAAFGAGRGFEVALVGRLAGELGTLARNRRIRFDQVLVAVGGTVGIQSTVDAAVL